jgi:ORF6N domain-containing protein
MPRPAKTLTTNQLEQLIREIRGHKVMLDFDLAKVYGVETKSLNRAVRRNVGRSRKISHFNSRAMNLKY